MVQNSRLHMTELGLHFSRSANVVSRLHGTIAQRQFPWSKIGYITNGVHHVYWMGSIMKRLYDKYLEGWRIEPNIFVHIDKIPDDELWEAHFKQKKALLSYANSQVSKALDKDTLTIGFARRAATYKRAQLIFSDSERLL